MIRRDVIEGLKNRGYRHEKQEYGGVWNDKRPDG